MRISNNFALLLFGLLVLVPSPGWASMTKNCPTEPAQNIPIVSGETYWGTNCVLKTTGDVDSFTFTASAGTTWRMVAGVGVFPPTNICMSLYAPGVPAKLIGSQCTNIGFSPYSFSASIEQKLAVAGLYTIVMTEPSSGVVTYGLSLELLNPAPPDGIPLVLSHNITGQVNPPSAQDAFTFYGSTSGTYQITASVPYNPSHDVCFSVYQPDGKVVVPQPPLNAPCTCNQCSPVSYSTIKANVTPLQNGTYVVVTNAAGNDGIVGYSLGTSCLVGTCLPQPPPRCTLADAATYNATTSTLTMKFTVGNNLGTSAIWNAWLTYADPQGTDPDTMQLLFSTLQPITNPPKAITKTFSLPKEGTVGVLSTLSTPHLSTAQTEGIACSSWVQVNTGTEP